MIAGHAWIARRLAMGDPTRMSRYCAAAGRRTAVTFNARVPFARVDVPFTAYQVAFT